MILLPFLTRYLEIQSYGAIAVYQSLTTVFVITSGSFVVAVLNREYYKNLKGHEADYSAAITASIFIAATLFIISALILGIVFFMTSINKNMFLMLISAVAQGFFTTLVQIRLGQYQIRRKPQRYILIQIGIAFINIILTIALVESLFRNEWGRILPQILAAGIFSLYSLITLLRNYYPRKLNDAIHQGILLIRKGIYLIPHMFVSAFLISVDKIIVASVLGLEAAGIYFASFQLARVLDLATNGVNKALIPYVFERMRSNDCLGFSNIMNKVKRVNLAFLLIGIIVFCLIISFGESFLGTKYKLDQFLVMFFCLGFVFKGWYLTASNFMFYYELNKELSNLSINTLIVSVGLLSSLSFYFGLRGAAFAFMTGMFLRFYLTYLKVRSKNEEIISGV